MTIKYTTSCGATVEKRHPMFETSYTYAASGKDKTIRSLLDDIWELQRELAELKGEPQ